MCRKRRFILLRECSIAIRAADGILPNDVGHGWVTGGDDLSSFILVGKPSITEPKSGEAEEGFTKITLVPPSKTNQPPAERKGEGIEIFNRGLAAWEWLHMSR